METLLIICITSLLVTGFFVFIIFDNTKKMHDKYEHLQELFLNYNLTLAERISDKSKAENQFSLEYQNLLQKDHLKIWDFLFKVLEIPHRTENNHLLQIMNKIENVSQEIQIIKELSQNTLPIIQSDSNEFIGEKQDTVLNPFVRHISQQASEAKSSLKKTGMVVEKDLEAIYDDGGNINQYFKKATIDKPEEKKKRY